MGFKIYLTEKQLDVVLKDLMLVEQYPLLKGQKSPFLTDREKADKNAKYTNTASWQRDKGGKMNIQLSAYGSNNFKSGVAEIDKNAVQIKKIVADLQKIALQGKATATVNGSASNTAWGGSPAGSPNAKKKNIELAAKRRDNLITYLKTLNLSNITFTQGAANLSDSDKDVNQKVTIDVKGSQVIDIEAKGDIGDKTRTSPIVPFYNPPGKKRNWDPIVKKIIPGHSKNVCIVIPENWIPEYKKIVSKWAFTKNGGRNINLKFKITTPSGLDLS